MDGRDEQENSTFQFSSQEAPPSSPLVPSTGSNRPKKPPPVTPRRFSRFFNPRSSRSSYVQSSKSGRELRDITRSATNARRDADFDDLPGIPPRKRQRKPSADDDDENATVDGGEEDAVERFNDGPDLCSSPPQSSPCARPTNPHVTEEQHDFPIPIKRARRQHVYSSLYNYTADFWSGPGDLYDYVNGADRTPMPFCIAACNTNSLVAVGDESGGIRLFETSSNPAPSFDEPYLAWSPHANAIMDLNFSHDDRLLGTAAGDHTARVIDMRTQTTLFLLNEHQSSVKQIAFQPGNDNIVATSSRDGTVGIWDLRCETKIPRRVIGEPDHVPDPKTVTPKNGKTVNSIIGGYTPEATDRSNGRGTPSTPSSRSTPSMTSMAFISASRPHHIVTAMDADSQVRLWDIRHRQRSRASVAGTIPISTTAAIPSHLAQRQYGITSLVFGCDSSRMYTVCRDSTIYAYSTAHLVLGAASSVFADSARVSTSRPVRVTGAEGARPLYGLRDPSLHVTTFFARAAVRRPVDDKPELLAVGSCDPNPIVFPTDETLLRKQGILTRIGCQPDGLQPPSGREAEPLSSPLSAGTALLSRSLGTPASRRGPSSRRAPATTDGIPIFGPGTRLRDGHARAVTDVAWTPGGDLVNISDDYTARVWREAGGKVRAHGGEEHADRPARWLRARPESSAWGFAVADVPGEWDEEDG